jgi:ABC-type dipeptide/oligopeptide/nickel transport system permease subunit
MTMIDIDDKPSSLWRDAWRRLRRNKLAVAGLVIIAALVIVAVFGPWLSPYDFLSQNLDLRNQPPSAQHWLGTDDLGRDVMSRLIYGARTAFMVAVGVTIIAVAIGVVLGAIAGFYGGWFDRFVMWFTDITMSVPQLLLVVVINASLKQPISLWMEARYMETLNPIYRNTQIVDFVLVFGAMALITWPPYARLVRAQVLSVRRRPYVTAARAMGLTNRLILTRYVLPNAMGPLIVAVSAARWCWKARSRSLALG